MRKRKAHRFFMNEVHDPERREAPAADLSSVSRAAVID